MKYRVKKGTPLTDLKRFLSPVIQYGEEKQRNNAQDDWDEYSHTLSWLKKALEELEYNSSCSLDIYYLDRDEEIVGVLFILSRSETLRTSLAADHILPSAENIAQLSCFHIVEAHRGRGLGRQWLTDTIFPDLKNNGIQTVYIRSSHNRALPLYQKLGRVVGNYIGISDHQLYQRYGYIFEINLSDY